MSRALVLLALIALASACSTETSPAPIANPPRPAEATEPTTTLPGAQLRAAKLTDQGLVPPTRWIESTDLRAFFPALPALSLRESWFVTDGHVCREASWAEPVEVVTTGATAIVQDLEARLTGNDEARRAEVTTGDARFVLAETRQRMGHEGRGGLSAPITSLLACTAPKPAIAWSDVLAQIVATWPPLADLEPSLHLDGVRAHLITYVRDAPKWDSVEVDVESDGAAAQTAWTRWIVDHHLAVVDPTLSYALDDPSRVRSFVLYPPDVKPGGFTIRGFLTPR